MEQEWLWFCSIPELYPKQKKTLLEQYKRPERIRYAKEAEIMELPYLQKKVKKSILEFQRKTEEELWAGLEKKQIRFYSFERKEYPQQLLQMTDFPYGLFVKGELPRKAERCIGIVGARMCTNYGRKMTRDITKALTECGVSIVSGMALGIDGIAQEMCLEKNGRSYAVVGCGCDICYPKEHWKLYEELSERGGILSEYPPGTPPFPSHFPMRNRIISGLCDSIIVMEAKKKSGSLITADLALEQGKDVYAVPGRIGDALSEGCNSLIFQGAEMVAGVENLLEMLDLKQMVTNDGKKEDNFLAICENMVYICVDFHGKTLEEIVDCTKYSVQEVWKALLNLQLKGLVYERSKNHYVRK